MVGFGGGRRHTISYHTIPYRTVPYRAIPYRTIPYRKRESNGVRVRPPSPPVQILWSAKRRCATHSVQSGHPLQTIRPKWPDAKCHLCDYAWLHAFTRNGGEARKILVPTLRSLAVGTSLPLLRRRDPDRGIHRVHSILRWASTGELSTADRDTAKLIGWPNADHAGY